MQLWVTNRISIESYWEQQGQKPIYRLDRQQRVTVDVNENLTAIDQLGLASALQLSCQF